MNGQFTQKTISISLFWRMLEKFGTQGMTFIVSIVLARILSPEHYGLIAMVTIFITIANIFVQTGLAYALIQKNEVDDLDYSSMFFVSMAMATLMYVLVYTIAPLLARFWDNQSLVNIFRVLSLILFLSPFTSIQNAIVYREMKFKKIFLRGLIATTISGVIGIGMALYGFGVWALVGQQLSNNLITMIVMMIFIKWRPRFRFSFKRVKGLIGYSWKILITVLIDTIFVSLRSFIIGKSFSYEILGYYNRGQSFPSLIFNNIYTSINEVLFPAFSRKQNDISVVASMARWAVKMGSFFTFPLATGLAAISNPLVLILLGEKWIPSVPFIQIFCIFFILRSRYGINIQIFNSLGRSDIYLKTELIIKVLDVVIIALSILFFDSAFAIAVGVVITTAIGAIINAYPNKKLIGYGFIDQSKDATPYIILSGIMGFSVYFLTYLGLNIFITFILQVLVGILIYVIGAFLFLSDTSQYVINVIKGTMSHNKGKYS